MSTKKKPSGSVAAAAPSGGVEADSNSNLELTSSSMATNNHPESKKQSKKMEVIQQHSEVVSVTTVKNHLPAAGGEHAYRHSNGKSRFWRNLLKLIVLTVAYLYATGALDKLARKHNNNVWFATYPKKSMCEWMNATAFEEAGVTSAVLKKMVFPRPVRGEKQLLVKVVKAAGNPVDYRMRRYPNWPLKLLPSISGYDFSGVVVDADKDSTYKSGDRVFGMLPTVTPYWGTFAEYVAVDEEFSAKIPDGMSFTEAAATPLAALTAMQSLMHLGPVVQNQTVLIHAGSGGVGSFLIQFAKKLLGLKVYTTSTSVDLCKKLGADYVIDYKKEDFASREYDYIIDAIGGEYFLRGIGRTRKHYVSILNGGWEDYLNEKLGTSWAIPHAIGVGEVFSNLFVNLRHYLSFGYYPSYSLAIVLTEGKSLEVIGNLIKTGVITVLLDNEYVGLEEGARQVHDRLQSGRAKGKVTLSIE